MDCSVGTPMWRALELMWGSYQAGSYPVGAVLTDATGAIVLEGRNHAGEATAAPGLMRGTTIAHAEMAVLAQLPRGDYEQHTLWTTLEPCLLCQAATLMSHVGNITYLGADALCVGLDALPTINAHASRRYPAMTGPADCLEARFAAILPIAVLLDAGVKEWAMEHRQLHAPADTAVAVRIVAEGLWPPRELDLDRAIEAIAQLL